MSLFEKIEMDPMEPAPPQRSSRSWRGAEKLTVRYLLGPKLITFFAPLLILPFLEIFVEEGLFAFQLICVIGLLGCLHIWADCLLTLDVTFLPDRIVKRSLTGQIVLPTTALYARIGSGEDITLSHVSDKNIRESVKIYRYLISESEHADIIGYLQDAYQVPLKEFRNGVAEVKSGSNRIAIDEYLKAVGSYRMMAAFFVVFAIIAVLTVGLSDNFFGVAYSLPAYPIRLAFIGIAIAVFFLLKRWADVAGRTGTIGVELVMSRLARANGHSFDSAAISVAVAALGLLLFLLFGNALDLYLFLLVGWLYFYDCYPRLSAWERLSVGKSAPEAAPAQAAVLPRRSLQISLVLMSTLAVMSYGENDHYLYANRKDCQDDWGDSSCQEVPGESTSSGGTGGSGGGGRYYGPRYGSGSGRPTHAIGLGSVSRGGFGSLGSFHASFGG